MRWYCADCWNRLRLMQEIREGCCPKHGYVGSKGAFFAGATTLATYPTKDSCDEVGPIKQEPLKKYYIAAKHIAQAILKGGNANCMRETLEEARAEAIAQVESEEVDCAVVVEIKLVARKPKKPVDVQEV